MTDKKEQLQEPIEEVEEKSDEDDGDSKAPSKFQKQKTSIKDKGPPVPKKKNLAKVVRGI